MPYIFSQQIPVTFLLRPDPVPKTNIDFLNLLPMMNEDGDDEIENITMPSPKKEEVLTNPATRGGNSV